MHSLLILTLSFCPAAPTLQESAVTDPVVCATGRGSALSIDELNELLLRRHARSPRGREILRHLLEGRLVDAIAKERGVSADDAEVKARIKTLEEQVRASGQAKDLEEYLESSGVDVAKRGTGPVLSDRAQNSSLHAFPHTGLFISRSRGSLCRST